MVRFFKNHGLLTLFGGTALIVIALCVVWPLAVFDWPTAETSSAARSIRWSRLQYTIMGSLTEAVAAIWVFFLGSCVGSFLNVVIYRVPLGQSVVSHASYCPKCGESIRPSDNVPVIGWLKLKGECRNCQLPISSRYPVVEFSIGLLFLLLHFVEFTSAGANLPVRPVGHTTGATATLFRPHWPLLCLTLYHAYLMCAVFSWAMILRDGNTVPTRAVVTTFAIGAVPAICFPMLQPLQMMTPAEIAGWLPKQIPDRLLPHFASAVAVFVGAVTGGAVGTVCQFIAKRIPFGVNAFDVASWMLIGIFLGWQAVIGTLVLVLIWLVIKGFAIQFTPPDPPAQQEMNELDPLLGMQPDDQPPRLTQRRLMELGIELGLFLCLVIHHTLWRRLWEQFYSST